MATTRIIPLHTGKGRTVGKAISDIIGYVKNPEKTDHGRLITSYQCDSRVADAQFLLDKQTYAARTGRVRGADDVIAYHLRQSFVPGEITGHMILVDEFITLNMSEAFKEMFFVVIQLGAILAVVVMFWNKMFPFQFKNKAENGQKTCGRKVCKIYALPETWRKSQE